MIATDLYDDDGDGPDFSRVVYHDLIIRLAVLVGATEAAGFLVREVSPTVSLKLLEHVRPDDSSADVRAAAVKAFEEIILPCVEKDKEGAIEVAEHRIPSEGAQYCLVTLSRDANRVPRFVSAFIVRCADQKEARERLAMLRGANSPYRKRRARADDRTADAGLERQSTPVASTPSPGWRGVGGWMSPNFGPIGCVGAILFYLLMVAGIAALLYMPWSLLKQ